MGDAPAKRLATCADVLAAPSHMVAEVVNGELHLSARPRSIHSRVWQLIGAWRAEAHPRVPRFDSIDFEFALLWARWRAP